MAIGCSLSVYIQLFDRHAEAHCSTYLGCNFNVNVKGQQLGKKSSSKTQEANLCKVLIGLLHGSRASSSSSCTTYQYFGSVHLAVFEIGRLDRLSGYQCKALHVAQPSSVFRVLPTQSCLLPGVSSVGSYVSRHLALLVRKPGLMTGEHRISQGQSSMNHSHLCLTLLGHVGCWASPDHGDRLWQ